jgi:hypothetical protein
MDGTAYMSSADSGAAGYLHCHFENQVPTATTGSTLKNACHRDSWLDVRRFDVNSPREPLACIPSFSLHGAYAAVRVRFRCGDIDSMEGPPNSD